MEVTFPGLLPTEGGGWYDYFNSLQKPTHTDRYLHYTLHHPVCIKRGVPYMSGREDIRRVCRRFNSLQIRDDCESTALQGQ